MGVFSPDWIGGVLPTLGPKARGLIPSNLNPFCLKWWYPHLSWTFCLVFLQHTLHAIIQNCAASRGSLLTRRNKRLRIGTSCNKRYLVHVRVLAAKQNRKVSDEHSTLALVTTISAARGCCLPHDWVLEQPITCNTAKPIDLESDG